jgi:hypothetical protein
MTHPLFRPRFPAALHPSEAGSSAQLCTPDIEPGTVDLVPYTNESLLAFKPTSFLAVEAECRPR